MMTKNWVKIYTSTNPIETEMVKQMLTNNDIISVVISCQDSSYNMFGTIDLYVHKNCQKSALKIMKKKYNV